MSSYQARVAELLFDILARLDGRLCVDGRVSVDVFREREVRDKKRRKRAGGGRLVGGFPKTCSANLRDSVVLDL